MDDLKANKAYRVPAKCRDLLEMRTTFTSRPKIDSLTWKTNGKDKVQLELMNQARFQNLMQ